MAWDKIKVDCCGRDIGVAKQFLDGFELSSALNQGSSKVVSQGVRSHVVNAGSHGVLLDDGVKAPPLKRE